MAEGHCFGEMGPKQYLSAINWAESYCFSAPKYAAETGLLSYSSGNTEIATFS